jgi:predicted peroxiredoxin
MLRRSPRCGEADLWKAVPSTRSRGDHLAELTNVYSVRPEEGPWSRKMRYAGTFLKQLEDVAALCLERGVKIVVNAGGLNRGALR